MEQKLRVKRNFMKLILIDGGPASGKNTLGTLLVEKLREAGNKTILLDLDTYVEEFNPSWIWENKKQEENDQQKARMNFTKDIRRYLKENYIVIAIGERILTTNDLSVFIDKLKIACSVYLYHLSISLALRKQRLHQRGSHSLIDLEKDQKERDEIKNWQGYIYKNINSAEEDALNLFRLIQDHKGIVGL